MPRGHSCFCAMRTLQARRMLLLTCTGELGKALGVHQPGNNLTGAPFVCVKFFQGLEFAALLAEPAVDAVDLGAHRGEVHRAHLVALIVGLCCTQVRAAAIHLWSNSTRCRTPVRSSSQLHARVLSSMCTECADCTKHFSEHCAAHTTMLG